MLRTLSFPGIVLLSGWALSSNGHTAAQAKQVPVIRLAEIAIDAAHIDEYRAALKEEIEASIRQEPGVLTLYAVTVKDHPTQVRLFEQYADAAAYQSHVLSPHFKKYKAATQTMVKSLRLVDVDPILLGSRPVER